MQCSLIWRSICLFAKLYRENSYKSTCTIWAHTCYMLYLLVYLIRIICLNPLRHVWKKIWFFFSERTAKLAYIDSYVKPPREVRRQQMKYGTAGPSTGERAKKFSHLMDPIALGRKEREEKGIWSRANFHDNAF